MPAEKKTKPLFFLQSLLRLSHTSPHARSPLNYRARCKGMESKSGLIANICITCCNNNNNKKKVIWKGNQILKTRNWIRKPIKKSSIHECYDSYLTATASSFEIHSGYSQPFTPEPLQQTTTTKNQPNCGFQLNQMHFQKCKFQKQHQSWNVSSSISPSKSWEHFVQCALF